MATTSEIQDAIEGTTLTDVRGWLASLPPTQVIGRTQDCLSCIMANYWGAKYPDYITMVSPSDIFNISPAHVHVMSLEDVPSDADSIMDADEMADCELDDESEDDRISVLAEYVGFDTPYCDLPQPINVLAQRFDRCQSDKGFVPVTADEALALVDRLLVEG